MGQEFESLNTHHKRGERSSVGRAPVCGTGCRGFESHRSPHTQGYRQAVRHRTLTAVFVGSNPAIPATYGLLAQSVEHLTFNQGVRGSIPR